MLKAKNVEVLTTAFLCYQVSKGGDPKSRRQSRRQSRREFRQQFFVDLQENLRLSTSDQSVEMVEPADEHLHLLDDDYIADVCDLVFAERQRATELATVTKRGVGQKMLLNEAYWRAPLDAFLNALSLGGTAEDPKVL